MEDHLHLPLHKTAISGPTLASLLHRSTASPSNTHGLLFGKFSLHSPPSLSDDCDSPSSSLIATITGFITTSSLNQYNHHSRRDVIGWFSCRRRSPLRPSLREFSITHSISSQLNNSPVIFLLVTTPFSDSPQTLIHTHEFRVYQFVPSNSSFQPTALEVVNIGPAFRGHYGAFSPASELPWLPCRVESESPMQEDENMNLKEMLRIVKDQLKRVAKDQKQLDVYLEGYKVRSLGQLVGNDAVEYMNGVEELYEKMLDKLDFLASEVESSSAKVLEMEIHNMKLRHRVAGLE